MEWRNTSQSHWQLRMDRSDSESEPGHPRWQTGDCSPEPQHIFQNDIHLNQRYRNLDILTIRATTFCIVATNICGLSQHGTRDHVVALLAHRLRRKLQDFWGNLRTRDINDVKPKLVRRAAETSTIWGLQLAALNANIQFIPHRKHSVRQLQAAIRQRCLAIYGTNHTEST